MNRTKTVLTLVVLAFIFLGIHFYALPGFDNNIVNRVDSYRLPTTADSFYYLRLSRDLQNGEYGASKDLAPSFYPSFPPLISSITVFLSNMLDINIESVAFFMSPLLACLLIPLAWFTTRYFFPDSFTAPIAACLAVAANFVLIRRTCIGYYDTDALNLVLLWCSFIFTYLLTVAKARRQFLWFGLFALTEVLVFLWWRPAAVPLAGICALFYALSVFTVTGQTGYEKIFKVFILVAGAAVCLAVIFGSKESFPVILQPFFVTLQEHFGLISGTIKTPYFNMGATIEELARPDLKTFVLDLFGSWIAFGCFLIGFYPYLKLGKTAVLFIFGLLLLFVGSVFAGSRFMLFLVPFIAMGCAGFCILLCNLLKQIKLIKKVAPVFSLGLTCILLFPSASNSIKYQPVASFTANTANLANAISYVVPEKAMLWNWWGPGYMLQYYGKRKTLVDGGSQTPELSYKSAVPLASLNPVMSRNWIRFFSVHRTGIAVINKYINDYAASVQFLVNIFCVPQNLDKEIKRIGLPKARNWQKFFFPKADVYLVLFSDMLIRNSWLSIGRTLPGSDSTVAAPIYNFKIDDCKIDLDKGRFKYNNEEFPYGMIFSVTPKSLSHEPGRNSDKVAIIIPDAGQLYYMNRDQFDCLTFRLLFVSPVGTPYFKKVVYNPFIGGIWKVE